MIIVFRKMKSETEKFQAGAFIHSVIYTDVFPYQTSGGIRTETNGLRSQNHYKP